MPIPTLDLKTSTSRSRVCNTETNIHRYLKVHLLKMAFTYRHWLISLTSCQIRTKYIAIWQLV
jgi:hypothetical protein